MTFRLVLWTIGALLAAASRVSDRVRSQLARDLTLVIRSRDGVARSYSVRGRRISSSAGDAADAACVVTFHTAAIGAQIFVAPDAIGRIVGGCESGEVECRGDVAIVLWFYELTIGLMPWPTRKAHVYPDAYTAPDPGMKAADRITREPAVAALDPAFTRAMTQRDKLEIWQVGRGAAPSGKVKHHSIVVDVPVPESGTGK